MKYKGQVFARKVREGNADGTKKLHRSGKDLAKLMGQGDLCLFHGRVYSKSGNGRVTFTVKEGALGDQLPGDDGFSVTIAGTYSNIVSLGSFKFNTTGDYSADLEVIAEVDAASGAALENVEFELWVTVITKAT